MMTCRFTACLTLLLSLCLAPAVLAAGKLAPRDVPMLGVRAFTFDSEVTGRSYDITVRFPAAFQQASDRRFPALLITDGNRFFPAVASALTAVESDLASPMLLIGVGTPLEEGQQAYNVRRVHEFSPPHWDLDDPFGRSVAETCNNAGVALDVCTGGAPEFLRFLRSELMPVLEQAFRVDPDKWSLGGISAGGFFAAWTLFQEGSPFRNYIISSPAMAYGDGMIFDLEQHFAENAGPLEGGLYLASGMLEVQHPYLEGVGRVVSGQARFGAALASRNYPGLFLASEIHPGLGHLDVVPVSFARGLRLLLGADRDRD